jgi:hypothetical protein
MYDYDIRAARRYETTLKIFASFLVLIFVGGVIALGYTLMYGMPN